MVKICFIDFDGTLYSHSANRIPESNLEAVRLMRDKGIKVFLCTGRSYYELDNFDLTGLQYDGMVSNNGQVGIVDKKIIYNYPMVDPLKQKVIDMFNRKVVPMFINTDNYMYMNYEDPVVNEIQKFINSPVPPVKEYEGENIYMCSAYYSNKEGWNELLALEQYANITYWHDGAIDIVPNTTNKAIGIQKILDYYGFSQEETVGLGDSENDIQMLKFCKIGIALGNASKETKEAADYVADDIDNDGVYKALKHFEII